MVLKTLLYRYLNYYLINLDIFIVIKQIWIYCKFMLQLVQHTSAPTNRLLLCMLPENILIIHCPHNPSSGNTNQNNQRIHSKARCNYGGHTLSTKIMFQDPPLPPSWSSPHPCFPSLMSLKIPNALNTDSILQRKYCLPQIIVNR